MGSGNSVSKFDYATQLQADKVAQSAVVKGDEVKGETPIRRAKGWEERPLLKYLREDEDGGYKTIWDAFQRGVKKFPKYNMFGTRKFEGDKRGDYVWETFEEVDKKVRGIAAGLTKLGVKAGDNVGILSINRSEWAEFALALYGSSVKCVPLYATLGDGAVEFIVSHADIEVIATNKEEYKKLSKSLSKLPKLKHVILFDYDEKYGNKHEVVDEKESAGDKSLISLSKLIASGDPNHTLEVPKESDPCFIMYTSGTTGVPKGAILTHGNLMAAVSTVPFVVDLNEKDVHISYLPLAHIFETIVQVAFYSLGGAIGFFQGDVKFLTDDMKALHPTFVPGVPRVFSRMYQRVMSGAKDKGCVKNAYFKKKYDQQAERLRENKPRDTSADEKVFIPIRKLIGMDRVRMVLSGAAPCPPYLIEFLKVVTGAVVIQGYGMTETAATISVTSPTDPCVGHVGPPLPNSEVKLRDVPELGYLSTDKDPRGELLVRGPCVFQGYYKDEEATKEAIQDGWLCTGDVARWNPNGTLSIIDRRRNIFKLPQGEYVASEKIEITLGKAPIVGQIWVYGNGFKTFLVGVVVPSMEVTHHFCQEKGWWPSTEKPVYGSPDFIKDYKAVWEGAHAAELKKELMDNLALHSGSLKGFEKLKDVIVETDINSLGLGFTEENECMTPTFKLRRMFLLKRYHEKLKKLFEDNGEPNAADEKWPGLK